MATAGTISIFVNAITKKFDDGISGVHKKLQGLTKGFADINGAFQLAESILGKVSTAVGILTDEIERLDAIGDTAERLNIAADSFVKLQRAAQLTGGEIEGVEKSLATLQRTLGDAALGGSGPAKALGILNLKASELIKLDLGEAFQKIVDRISKLPTPAERASVAADLFGRSAMNLTGLMTQGASAFAEATSEVEKFGARLDETRMKSVDEAQKAIERLQMSWGGLKSEAALTFAPGTADAADFTAEGLAGIRKMSAQEVIAAMALGGPLGLLMHGNTKLTDPSGVPAMPGFHADAFRNQPHFMAGPNQSSLFDMRMATRRQNFNVPGGGPSTSDAWGDVFSVMEFIQRREARSVTARGGVGAAEFGSLAAYQAVQASQRQDEALKLQRQELEEAKKTNKALDRVIENAIVLSELDLQG